MSENPQSVWFWMQSNHENGLTSARRPRSLMSFTCGVINLNQPSHGFARRAVHAARFPSTWRTNPLYNPVSTPGFCWFCCLQLEEFLVAPVNCKLAAWSCLQASYCLSCRENPYRQPDVSCSWTKVQHLGSPAVGSSQQKNAVCSIQRFVGRVTEYTLRIQSSTSAHTSMSCFG